ncbi:MAG: hypothetical protein V2I97_13180 [Desulfococcaceae bacterium]|jgi:hypothetical protein|nr:hypothetical protein [Desulfococcaceae bacterium]
MKENAAHTIPDEPAADKTVSGADADSMTENVSDESADNPADELNALKKKSRARTDAGRDPRTVSWQQNLESLLIKIRKSLIPGEIISTESLDKEKKKIFDKVRISLDLAPFVTAVFLPPAIADGLKPGDNARSFERASDNSYKILVSRIHDYNRILTAEISAHNPGIDILDDGSLLGCYNYSSPGECISDLSKIIWIHLKHISTWSHEDYIRYTESWFFRSAVNRMTDLPINVNHSYIHHPVLIGLTPVKAVFRLIQSTMNRLCADPVHVITLANDANLYKSNTVEISREGLVRGDSQQQNSLRIYVDEKLLSLLKFLKGFDIINFKSFSEAEQREFKRSFPRLVEDIYRMLLKKIGAPVPEAE